jgi:hypothetical protein
MLVDSLEDQGRRVGDVVDAGARQALLGQQGDGFVQLTAPVFEVGGGAPHHRDEALEDFSNRFAGPTRRHIDPNAVDLRQRERPGSQVMVMGFNGQDG